MSFSAGLSRRLTVVLRPALRLIALVVPNRVVKLHTDIGGCLPNSSNLGAIFGVSTEGGLSTAMRTASAIQPSPLGSQTLPFVDLQAGRTAEVFPIIRAAIFLYDLSSASVPVAYPRHNSDFPTAIPSVNICQCVPPDPSRPLTTTETPHCSSRSTSSRALRWPASDRLPASAALRSKNVIEMNRGTSVTMA